MLPIADLSYDRSSLGSVWKDIPRIRDITRSSRRINLPIVCKSPRKRGGRKVKWAIDYSPSRVFFLLFSLEKERLCYSVDTKTFDWKERERGKVVSEIP